MSQYITIGAMLASICLLAGWMFIASHVHYLLKMVGATAIVGLSIVIWSYGVALLGYPVHDFPPDNSVILAVDIDVDHAISFWVRNRPPRAYSVPYEPGLAQQIVQAEQQAKESGGQMILHRNGKGSGDGQGQPGDGHGHPGGQHGQNHGSGQGVTNFSGNVEGGGISIDVVSPLPEKT